MVSSKSSPTNCHIAQIVCLIFIYFSFFCILLKDVALDYNEYVWKYFHKLPLLTQKLGPNLDQIDCDIVHFKVKINLGFYLVKRILGFSPCHSRSSVFFWPRNIDFFLKRFLGLNSHCRILKITIYSKHLYLLKWSWNHVNPNGEIVVGSNLHLVDFYFGKFYIESKNYLYTMTFSTPFHIVSMQFNGTFC